VGYQGRNTRDISEIGAIERERGFPMRGSAKRKRVNREGSFHKWPSLEVIVSPVGGGVGVPRRRGLLPWGANGGNGVTDKKGRSKTKTR